MGLRNLSSVSTCAAVQSPFNTAATLKQKSESHNSTRNSTMSSISIQAHAKGLTVALKLHNLISFFFFPSPCSFCYSYPDLLSILQVGSCLRDFALAFSLSWNTLFWDTYVAKYIMFSKSSLKPPLPNKSYKHNLNCHLWHSYSALFFPVVLIHFSHTI